VIIDCYLLDTHSVCGRVCLLQHKAEMLHAVQTLHKMGYKLSGSTGTAEYYSAKGIKVSLSERSCTSFHLCHDQKTSATWPAKMHANTNYCD